LGGQSRIEPKSSVVVPFEKIADQQRTDGCCSHMASQIRSVASCGSVSLQLGTRIAGATAII